MLVSKDSSIPYQIVVALVAAVIFRVQRVGFGSG
jgi:hypothetical protein